VTALGTLRWTFGDRRGRSARRPPSADGTVYVGSNDGPLYPFAATGREVEPRTGGAVFSPTLLLDGRWSWRAGTASSTPSVTREAAAARSALAQVGGRPREHRPRAAPAGRRVLTRAPAPSASRPVVSGGRRHGRRRRGPRKRASTVTVPGLSPRSSRTRATPSASVSALSGLRAAEPPFTSKNTRSLGSPRPSWSVARAASSVRAPGREASGPSPRGR